LRSREPALGIEARMRHQTEPLRYVLENPLVGTPDGNKHVFDKVLVNNDLGTTVNEILCLFQSVLFKEGAL
jgi:hypothetical protein